MLANIHSEFLKNLVVKTLPREKWGGNEFVKESLNKLTCKHIYLRVCGWVEATTHAYPLGVWLLP